MELPREHPVDEIKRLQRCINDLIGVLALPAIWTGGEPSQIADTLIDSVQGMLRLDLVYVRLNGPAGEPPIEVVQAGDLRGPAAPPNEIGDALRHWLAEDPQTWPALARHPIGSGFLTIVPFRLGLSGEFGAIVAGAERANFPVETERLLLSVAANQAAIGLQGARRLSEQRRIAEERVRHEEAELKRSEARKAAILDSALECIVTIDHQGRITEFNRAAERTFGYRRNDVVGKPLADALIPPSLRERHREGFARYLRTGHATVLGRRIEMTAMRADGSEFPVELAITRIPVDGPPSFTGCLRDVTERKRSEEELRRSEAFLSEAQRLSATGSFSWRVATDDITWSDELYRIFAFPRGTPVTFERIIDRVHPEDAPSVRDMIARARDGGSDFEFDLRLRMQDQSVKYLHMVAHGSHGQDGRLEYIGAIQDVTQRRLSEQELGEVRSALSHASRVMSLGVMTASIAHEVNQPLSGIMTNASTCLRMLAADPPNVGGARETARRTIRDANRASEVITRLRALFARSVTATALVDLNEAAREVIALSLTELQRTSVILRSEFAEDLPPVRGDRVQLQQVILNLLRNASDAMRDVDDRPRHLLIKTDRDDGDRVRLSVQDVGVGLEPQAINRLFDAFYSTKRDGMGIGLSVSRAIIESHQGRLWAAPNDGPGATFAFSIPRDPGNQTPAHPPGAVPAPTAAGAAQAVRNS